MTDRNPTPNLRSREDLHALCARQDADSAEQDFRAYREACLSQALAEVLAENVDLRARIRELELGS